MYRASRSAVVEPLLVDVVERDRRARQLGELAQVGEQICVNSTLPAPISVMFVMIDSVLLGASSRKNAHPGHN